MNKTDKAFYSGIITALICVSIFDQPVIIEEIVGTLGDDERKELIKFAKDNSDYEISGLKQYEDDTAQRNSELLQV